MSSWIVTRDKDFRSLVKFLTWDVPGIIVIESEGELTRTQVVDVFDRFLGQFEDKLTEKQLIIVEDDRIAVLNPV